MEPVLVLKALAHPTRLYIVESLLEVDEKCICQFLEELDFKQSTISKHMAILRNAGLVMSRKEGLNTHYRIAHPDVDQLITSLHALSASSVPT